MNWKHLLFVVALACLGFAGIGSSSALAAEPLKYQFKGVTEPTYEFTIRAELPDSIETHTGMITYNIKSVDPANGQIRLSYTSEMRTDTQQKRPDNRHRFPGFPPMHSPFGPAPQASPDILISPQGGVIRSNRADDASQLPHLLGFTWQLLLQPLAEDGASTWKTQRTIALYTKTEQKRWPPPAPWERQADDRVDRSAHETITYTLGQANGSVIPVQRDYDLSTDEKAGSAPVLRQSGTGQFLFDTKSGLIQSLDMKLTIEVNQENVTIKIPVTVSARMFAPEELAKLKAKREADFAAAMAQAAQSAAANKENEQGLAVAARTPEVGGLLGAKGGSPFARAKENAQVIGFRYSMSNWAGEGVLRDFEPLYEKPASKEEGKIDEVAKDGYVVAGMIVAHAQYPNAVQIIFARMKDGKLDMATAYQSKWLGVPKGSSRTQLAGKGERVVGTFGRKGLNINTIGLMVADPAAAAAVGNAQAPTEVVAAETAPAGTSAQTGTYKLVGMPKDLAEQLKRIKPMWQKTTGKPTEILAGMRGASKKGDQGGILLSRGQRLTTPVSYKAPATFRIVCMSEHKDLRVGYAADQIIFNWEMNPDELRLDGGPAGGPRKEDFGRLPANEWVALEIAVRGSDITIYVNGKQRYRGFGDFSTVNEPFTLTAHGGDLTVASVCVVR